MTKSSQFQSSPVQEGMPPLEHGERTTSYFEFWPMWVFYLPVALQWLVLGLRYRSLSLPLLANPAIPLSGMVGVPKSAVFDRAGVTARDWILPWCLYEVSSESPRAQLRQVMELLERQGLTFPVVGKPDIGCRGAGVKLLRDSEALATYIGEFPPGGSIQFQQLSHWEPEAGIFYVRHPHEDSGRISSLTLKYTPFVIGDGEKTLAELVAADSRAGELLHLYQGRHAGSWQRVLDAGEVYRLVFSASHCRGAVFRDAAHLISTELSNSLDRIFQDIPGFYYGRLDVKFKDIESLQQGRDFAIIEINGASSESINIWDRDAGLLQALGTLLHQYSTLFKLGHANRQRGLTPPGLIALYRAWRHEKKLVQQYPRND